MTRAAAPTMRRIDTKRHKAVGALAGAVDRLFNDTILQARRAPQGGLGEVGGVGGFGHRGVTSSSWQADGPAALCQRSKNLDHLIQRYQYL